MPSQVPSTRPRPTLCAGLRPGRDPEVWTFVIVDGWVAACRFTMQQGRLVIVELRCFPHDPAAAPNAGGLPEHVGWSEGPAAVPTGGLTKRWLGRAVAIGDHLREADGAVRYAQGAPRGSLWRKVEAMMLGAPMLDTPLAPRAHPRGRGRPPTDEALFLRVAVEYDRALRSADAHQVNHVVAARLKLTPARVRTLVHQARNKYGFLTKTHQGVPGGRLTPLARSRLSTKPKGARPKTGVRRRRRRS